jgi:UDP-N-acetylmuramate dehydrogenase
VIPALDILDRVPLARHTTLELGGPARFYLRAKGEADVISGLEWAHRRGAAVAILGGGSNLVVGDDGYDGLVIEMVQCGIEEQARGDRVLITAAAGEEWDELVGRTVSAGFSGLECLSGIPGRVGATPIQNVGAYGQEVSETLVSVRAVDRETLAIVTLDRDECELSYRDSFFKRHPERYVILSATFALTPEGAPAVRYAELERALAQIGSFDLPTVRETVVELRRAKSMILDGADPNGRSAGSFFMNPIVAAQDADAIVARAIADGIAASEREVPRWPAEGGRVKLAAGWLIERAGIAKGMRLGNVGVSSKHALALVHHGGGSTRELLELAERVRAAVEARFGVQLVPEPVFWGARLPM